MESPQPVQSPAPPSVFDRLKNKWQHWKRAKILHITEEQTEEEKLLGKEWDQLGFHRPIGGVFYAIGFLPIVAVVGIFLLPLAQFTKLRFVEIGSFEAIAMGLFGAVYNILDFELGRGIQRFVPEYLIKDPRKATQFATFFIKYQMWTGLGQVTLLSVVILFLLGNTNMAYLIYFLLFINIKQYPGQLGVFDSILDAHQQFSKQYMRTFWQIEIVQNITGPVFGIIGLFYGISNPVIGELMGLALGYAIGTYVGLIFFDVFVVYDLLQAVLGDGLIVISTAITILLVIFMAFLVYLPLYAFFGGFDEFSLNVYKKAVALTGPSIIITWPFYKLFAFGYRHSPFKQRAKITFSEEAGKEVLELARLRLEGRANAAKEA